MQIILLDKIAKLGNIGDQVNVKAGYARNFLIPTKKAVSATKENIQYFNTQRAALEADFQKRLAESTAIAEKIESLATITISSKSGDQGRLFGSIGTKDITDALAAHDINLDKGQVRIPQGTIRVLGSYQATINLHANISTSIAVEVVAE
ncbi:MAG: 50S ribosomal protein L9 [Psittacicella sp.]